MYVDECKCMCMNGGGGGAPGMSVIHRGHGSAAAGGPISHRGHVSAAAGGPIHWGPIVMAFQEGSNEYDHGIHSSCGRLPRPEGKVGHGISSWHMPCLEAQEPSAVPALTEGSHSR